MSINQHPPKESIKSPITGRFIKVGGTQWKKLLREGVITADNYTDPNELADIPEDQSYIETEQKVAVLNEELPVDQIAVRGRGKYKGKLVKAYKTPKRKQTSYDIQDEDAEEIPQEEDDRILERMILEELSLSKPVLRRQKAMRKQTIKSSTFTEEEEDSDEEEDEEDSDYESDY